MPNRIIQFSISVFCTMKCNKKTLTTELMKIDLTEDSSFLLTRGVNVGFGAKKYLKDYL